MGTGGRKMKFKNKLAQIASSLRDTNTSRALFTLLIFFVASTIFVNRFFTLNNLINVLRQSALVFSFSIGMAIAMLLAGLDLSIGAVAAYSGVLAASLISNGYIVLGIIVGLLVGITCGLISGVIISKYKVPPFIMTFGMMKIASGLALNFTKGESIYGLSDKFRWIGVGTIGLIPAPLIICTVLLILLAYFGKRSVLGRRIYAVGSNRNAARFSGIPCERTLMIGYALSGLFSGIAGLMFVARLGSAEGIMGDGWPLQAIAACVLGGVSFAGGEGTIQGAAIGALCVAIMYNVLNLLGVSPSWQQFLIGFVIIFVISIDFIKSQIIRKKNISNKLRTMQKTA